MAKFLSWATNVLEAVDQSAATISQKDISKKRRSGHGRTATLEGAASDGNASETFDASDSVALSEGEGSAPGYASDGRKGGFHAASTPDLQLGPGGTLKLSSSSLNRSDNGNVPQLPKPTPISSLAQQRRTTATTAATVDHSQPPNTPPTSSQREALTKEKHHSSPVVMNTLRHTSTTGRSVPTAGIPGIDPMSALFEAKAPSAALARLRATRRSVEGRVWASESDKAAFEEEMRRASEAEARVSVMIADVERLKSAAGRAAAAHAQERESVERDRSAAKGLLKKEALAFAAAQMEWKMRCAELVEEGASYSKAVESMRQQSEEKAKEAEQLEHAAEEAEAKASVAVASQESEMAAEAELEIRLNENEERDEGSEQGHMEGCVEGHSEDNYSTQGGPDAVEEELEMLVRRVKELEAEVGARSQWASKTPTPAQRESQLEKRLRSLSEQLMMKQAQTEELANEVNALSAHVGQVLQQRAGLKASEDQVQDFRAGMRTGTRSGRRRHSDVFSSVYADELDTPGRARTRRSGAISLHGMRRSIDSLSEVAGSVLSKSVSARLLLVAYMFCLHFLVLVILSLAANERKTKEKGHFH